ncbi:Gfo/Idh/MocA family oxidoreductase [Streptomyces sp. SID3343]|uniref:Gfo/Idh/MocA family protein n=1 Tax=Streptomyces sp. SID3343 TaxID=2690260 RepID=UPI00136DF025|nr:Gfo/Idh/MocA family oxidoreductase [Streptomyces sp. SID3343]MYV97080.1 Gfo/Idh/MocA family oxidoreductase [Streptomyces sp. SID3343]
MKVGVIGLGDIAEKAYLPVLSTLPDLELRLHTRTPATLRRVAEAYRVPAEHCHADLDGLLAESLDAAFVHAATSAHPEIVTRLIEAGVPTYVDKPLAYSLDESARLIELARARGVGLMVGFNRRHVPAYAESRELPRDLIVIRRNRVDTARELRTVTFDDLIHVVDTLRFLAPGEIERVDVRARVVDGFAQHFVLHLSGSGFSAIGMLNLRSGSNQEILEVSGRDGTREVYNLADVVDHHQGLPTTRRRGDWTPIARQRGIEQVVLTFLDAVRTGVFPDLDDTLRTHEMCELVVAEVEKQLG